MIYILFSNSIFNSSSKSAPLSLFANITEHNTSSLLPHKFKKTVKGKIFKTYYQNPAKE